MKRLLRIMTLAARTSIMWTLPPWRRSSRHSGREQVDKTNTESSGDAGEALLQLERLAPGKSITHQFGNDTGPSTRLSARRDENVPGLSCVRIEYLIDGEHLYTLKPESYARHDLNLAYGTAATLSGPDLSEFVKQVEGGHREWVRDVSPIVLSGRIVDWWIDGVDKTEAGIDFEIRVAGQREQDETDEIRERLAAQGFNMG